MRRSRAEGGPSELIAENTPAGALRLSPDGKWIAWGEPIGGGTERPTRIIVAGTDGSEARPIGEYTTNPQGFRYVPAYFDAYSSTVNGVPLVTPSDPALQAATQLWSLPTGFAFEVGADAGVPAGSYFVDKSSGARHFLGADGIRGTWGSWVALAAGDDPAARTLTFMQPDGSDRHTLPVPVSDEARVWVRERHVLVAPAWSADRNRIETLSLFHLDDLAHPLHAAYRGQSLGFSPEESRIAFEADEAGAAVLRVVTFDGQELARVPSAVGVEFSPDGSHFVFQMPYEGALALCSLDAAGNVRVHARGRVITWLSSTRLLVTHGDLPFQQGIYALDLAE